MVCVLNFGKYCLVAGREQDAQVTFFYSKLENQTANFIIGD